MAMALDGQPLLSALGVLGFAAGAVVLAADGRPLLSALLAFFTLVLLGVVASRR